MSSRKDATSASESKATFTSPLPQIILCQNGVSFVKVGNETVRLDDLFLESRHFESLEEPYIKFRETPVTPEDHDGPPPTSTSLEPMWMYQKLWEVDSIEEFQTVFLDCLECHYLAYHSEKILHQNISDKSMVFWRRDKDDVYGILSDWDTASDVNEAGDPSPTEITHRTETLPFLAIDLCQHTPPSHLYRHDLESFFYVLVWAALHYDFTTKERAAFPAEPVQKWNKALEDSGVTKSLFFHSAEVAQVVFGAVRPEFEDMKNRWLIPLRQLFADAFSSRPSLLSPRPDESEVYDFKTFNGALTFETFMKAIGRTPREEFSKDI